MTITALTLHSTTEKSQHKRYNSHSVVSPNWLSHFGETEIEPSPYNSEFVQVLSTGERCSPLQIIRESLSCRKIATLGAGFYFVLVHNFGQLCPFLIPHSSFPTPPCCFFSNFVL